MYIPKKHIVEDPEKVIAFISKYSFACVVCQSESAPLIVHIPLEVEIRDEELFLSGHVAKGNPITKSILSKDKSVAIFMQPHAYVSSSWYDHVNVPTWNYIAVHCTGNLRILEGQELLASISKMVEHYEKDRPSRYNISDMPEDMLNAHLDGLTGFEMKVDEIEAKFKLSQNRHDKDFKNVIKHLLQSTDPLERDIAQEMINLRPELHEG